VQLGVPENNPVNQGLSASVPIVVAHRGASACAPEHTEAAYAAAIEMGSDFVEQDLQVTRDGVLVCSHDPELSRTTDARIRFPERATMRDPYGRGPAQLGWYIADFTLAEVKTLDAGSWYNRANPFAARSGYAGLRIQTLDEAIELVSGRAGLYIETKHVDFYASLGYDLVARLVRTLRAHGLNGNDDSGSPVLIQSFSRQSLLDLAGLDPQYRRIQLLPMEDPGRNDSGRITPELAEEIAEYACGVGPDKAMVRSRQDSAVLHRSGLKIHPYTFRGGTSSVLRKPLDESEGNGRTVRENILSEIRSYLDMGVDGGFCDYPDLWIEAVLNN
jgi:glycerophosphoryl diester phosphodiesterase